jgi:hypothetical protein
MNRISVNPRFLRGLRPHRSPWGRSQVAASRAFRSIPPAPSAVGAGTAARRSATLGVTAQGLEWTGRGLAGRRGRRGRRLTPPAPCPPQHRAAARDRPWPSPPPRPPCRRRGCCTGAFLNRPLRFSSCASTSSTASSPSSTWPRGAASRQRHAAWGSRRQGQPGAGLRQRAADSGGGERGTARGGPRALIDSLAQQRAEKPGADCAPGS